MSETLQGLPDTLALVWAGSPGKQEVYRGDGLFCDLEQPKTCHVVVDIDKAAQLINDFPDAYWTISGNATQAAHIRKLLKGIRPNSNIKASTEVRKGAARLIFDSGHEVVLPAGAKVTIEMPPGKRLGKPVLPAKT